MIKSVSTAAVQRTLAETNSKRIHRHCDPSFIRETKNLLLRRLVYRIRMHNWRKNEHAIQYRISEGQRIAIRSEARETLTALCTAIAHYTEWGKTPNQFECWADAPYLAKVCNAAYVRDDSVMRYDVIYHALDILEGMQAVLVARDYDKNTKMWKLSRVFVLPAFFRMFGFSDKETKKMLIKNQAAMDKNPQGITVREKMWAAHLSDRTRASIRGRANSRKIDYMRKKFAPGAMNDDSAAASVVHLAAAAANHESFVDGSKYLNDDVEAIQSSWALRQKFSPADVYMLQRKFRAEFSSFPDDEIEQIVDDELRKMLLRH